MRAHRFLSRSAEETFQFGVDLAKTLKGGDCLGLVGGLGSGKTTFVQGLARGLGVRGPVTSPSYLIVQEYWGEVPLFHVDAYRLSGAVELEEIGFAEYLHAGGVVAVEWADRVREALPADCTWITFESPDPQTRRLTLRQAPPLPDATAA